MVKTNEISHLTLPLISVLLSLGFAFADKPTAAQNLQPTSRVASERFPGKGLRIIEVYPGSAAERAGLKPMDLIFRYGEFEIVDDASYFAARDAYEKSPGATKSISQCAGCFFYRQQLGIRNHPEAELFVFQSGFEIRNQNVE